MSLFVASLIDDINIKNFMIHDIKTKYLEKNIDVHSTAKINFDNKFISHITASFIEKVGTKTQIFFEDGVIIELLLNFFSYFNNALSPFLFTSFIILVTEIELALNLFFLFDNR